MKILVYACHFTPDPIGVGKFSGEMAEWLAEQGHEVRAVVGVPFYPYWKVPQGYAPYKYFLERARGVCVLRCPIWVPRRPTGLNRILQYLTLVLTSAFPLLWWTVLWRPDVIWTVMPPTAGFVVALGAARIGGKPTWLHVQDFEVDAAFELGLLKWSSMRALMLKIERSLLSSFTVVSTITKKMMEKLVEKGVTAEKVLLPNWADIELIFPMASPSPLRAELDISPDAIVALYSGNLGEKQGVDDLVQVAKRVAHLKNIIVAICGDGAGRARLAALAGDTPNVLLLPVQPLERLNGLLNLADVHLLPQKGEVADLVMPSKLGGMLASGRPIIAAANPGTQIFNELEGVGVLVPPGDVDAMTNALVELSHSPEQRRQMGNRSVERAREGWQKTPILKSFEKALEKMMKQASDGG